MPEEPQADNDLVDNRGGAYDPVEMPAPGSPKPPTSISFPQRRKDCGARARGRAAG
jgi:hypothetical protein